MAAALEALRVSEGRYRAVFDTILDAIVISRMDDGMFVDVNRRFSLLFGYEREELIGQSAEEPCIWEDEEGEQHQGRFLDVAGRSSRDLNLWADPGERERLMGVLRREGLCRDFEARFRGKSGKLVWVQMAVSAIELDGVACALFAIRDVSAAKAAEEEIRNLSHYDGLTCLPNRRYLLERLHGCRGGASESGKGALLSINLDHFRAVNDSLGGSIGDLLLQEAARRIAACVREGDTVARPGGDEFMVILENLSGATEEAAAQARSICQRVLWSLSRPYELAGRDCRCTASIGIAIFCGTSESAEEILQQSGIAVDQARLAGRNTMRFFAPALQSAINERVGMEADLRRAIEEDQLLLHYQPQVCRGQMAGAEALVRWRHPRRGLLSPGDFIPLAEETGLILPLGDWVLESACRQASAWARSGTLRHTRIAVNISARQFRQPDFAEKVIGTLRETGAKPENIELELTESSLAEDVDQIVARMTELKDYGLRFSVDDFGVGYSSLSYLKRLPLDKLKIDISFVRDILVDSGSRAITQAVIWLARALDLKVVAEGVESEEQHEVLAELGCEVCQGFLFSRPLPAGEFERMAARMHSAGSEAGAGWLPGAVSEEMAVLAGADDLLGERDSAGTC